MKKASRLFAIATATILLPQYAFASEMLHGYVGTLPPAARLREGTPPPPPSPPPPSKDIGDISGVSWGFGLGASVASKVNVTSTVVQNGILRLSGGDRSSIGPWAEIHHFWGIGAPTTVTVMDSNGNVVLNADGSNKTVEAHALGIGPFIGAQFGSDSKILQSLGAGIMFGARPSSDAKNSMNIGAGYAAMQISVLTNGLALDQPLPAGITTATMHNKIVGGWFVMTSFSF